MLCRDMGLKVNTIKSSDTNIFKVSADQLKKDGAVIGKIYKGYQLAVLSKHRSGYSAQR
jgi:methylthioribose-1-phosphate isomerase